MKYIPVILLLFLPFYCYSQSVEELENDLRSLFNQSYGGKINKALLLQKKDPFNETAVKYICRYYYDRKIDSVSAFFDQLISRFPNRPEPFILRALCITQELRDCPDSVITDKKEYYLKKAMATDRINPTAAYLLAELYYRDFLVPFERSENNYSYHAADNTHADKGLEFSRHSEKKSFFSHPADSALCYFYIAETINSNIGSILYFPEKQLERYLGRTGIVRLDSLSSLYDNCYFPIWYFANLSPGWENDFSVYYLNSINFSKGRADWIKTQLEALHEPCLFNSARSQAKDIYRFTWLRSFDPPVVVRIEKDKDKIMVYWKEGKGAGGYYPIGLKNSGERVVSLSEWNEFMKIFSTVKFDELPDEDYVLMIDGSSWILEKKSAKSFKAVETNSPGEYFEKSCLFLLSLTDIKVRKEDTY